MDVLSESKIFKNIEIANENHSIFLIKFNFDINDLSKILEIIRQKEFTIELVSENSDIKIVINDIDGSFIFLPANIYLENMNYINYYFKK